MAGRWDQSCKIIITEEVKVTREELETKVACLGLSSSSSSSFKRFLLIRVINADKHNALLNRPIFSVDSMPPATGSSS